MTRFLKSSNKAAHADYSHSGERSLPKIPHHGPAAQLSQRVLLSKIEEKGAGDEYNAKQEENPGTKQYTLPDRKSQGAGPKEHSLINKLRTMLYKTDHLQRPPKLDSVLTAGCQSQDAIPEDTHHEELASMSDSRMLYQASSASLLSSASNLLKRVASHASVPENGGAGSPKSGGGSPKSGKPRSNDQSLMSSLKSESRDLPRLRSPGNHIASEVAASTAFTGPKKKSNQMASRGSLNRSSVSRSSLSNTFRAERLRNCFERSFADIDAVLNDLENHYGNEFMKTVKTGGKDESEGKQFKFALGKKKAQSGDGLGQQKSKPPPSWLKEFISVYEKSTIGLVAPKPIPGCKDASQSKDGSSEGPPLVARPDELSKCVAVLNLYRWLCKIPPVQLENHCTKACDTVCQILTPRQPVFVKPSSQQYKQITELSGPATKFVAQDGNVCLLHCESSLIQGIGLALTSAHTVNLEEVARRPALSLSQRLKEVHDRASKSQEVSNPDFVVQETGAVTILLRQQARVSLDNLPKPLAPLRFLWEFAAAEKGQFPGAEVKDSPGSPSQKQQSLQSPRISSSPRADPLFSPGRVLSSGRSGPITKKIPWCGGRPLSERGMAIEQGVFWGDRENSICFRRYLLNPRLKMFGAQRRLDTCAFFIGELTDEQVKEIEDQNSGLELADWEKAAADKLNSSSRPVEAAQMPLELRSQVDGEPEVVCFPPPGIVPLNIMHDQVPTWSIMPNCKQFQPSTQLQVEMWRVKIEGERADRIEQVRTYCLSTDCSQKGNPFCIIFRADLARIVDGDEFEVVVSGLRKQPSQPDLVFFHRFQDFRGLEGDAQLVGAINRYRKILDDMIFWQRKEDDKGQPEQKESRKSIDSSAPRQSSKQPINEEMSSSKRAGHGESLTSLSKRAEEEKVPEIHLVSHPNKTFHSDKVDVVISVYCPDVACMRCHLFLIRVNSKEEIQRCTMVTKVSEYFIVRVKLPMAHCKWELSFKVSTHKSPEVLLDSPLKYTITSAETCQNLLISVEHALKEKFGFCALQIRSQIYGVTILAPTTHRVRSGYAYFLVHIDPKNRSKPNEPQVPAGEAPPPPTATLLFSDRLAPPLTTQAGLGKHRRTRGSFGNGDRQGTMNSEDLNKTDATLRATTGGSKSSSLRHSVTGATRMSSTLGSLGATTNMDTCCAIGALHDLLSDPDQGIESFVQDTAGGVHLDLSINDGKYMHRLRQRPDFPDLHEGTFQFDENEAGSKIEMFLRFPRGHASSYIPLKISEWLMIRRKEHFPMGF